MDHITPVGELVQAHARQEQGCCANIDRALVSLEAEVERIRSEYKLLERDYQQAASERAQASEDALRLRELLQRTARSLSRAGHDAWAAALEREADDV